MRLVTLISVVVLLKTATADDLPSYFPKCYIDDPELNSCLFKGFQMVKPYVGNGIKEIGLPPLNPLIVSEPITISQNTLLARYTLLVKNFTVRGLDDYDIREIQYDPNTMTFYGSILFNKIRKTVYGDILGHIISVPLEGKAASEELIIGPIIGNFLINGKLVNEKGIDYYNTTNVDVKLNIEGGSYLLDGLFDNNVFLTRNVNNIFNSNSKLVTEAVTPIFEEVSKLGIIHLMSSLTNRIPYNQLFPRRN